MEGDEGVEVSSQRVTTEKVSLNEELGSRVAEGSYASEIYKVQGIEGIVLSIFSASDNLPLTSIVTEVLGAEGEKNVSDTLKEGSTSLEKEHAVVEKFVERVYV